MKTTLLLLKKYWLVVLALLIPLIMFYPSISAFFTHDDFYFLKISKVDSFREFINFFNLIKDTDGIGVYRPLTLRVFYFLGSTLFNLNPLGLRLISIITFYADVVLVGYLAKLLSKNTNVGILSMFLYAVSVTHFGQLYYVGAYQELFLTLTFLLSIIFYAKHELQKNNKLFSGSLLASFVFFLMALMSKETAVVIPVIIVGVHVYFRITGRTNLSLRKLVSSILPYLIVLGAYLFLHFQYFGLIKGDSYIWDLSPVRAINTTAWYFLWSLNLPEMLVDFVGPGIHLNPNLMKYWSPHMIPIFILFVIQLAIIVFAILKSKISSYKSIILLSIFWFILTLLPVMFLPLHKFTYYLTLPLFGIVLFLSYLFINLKSKIYILFCIIWVTLSVYSLRLTIKTNWITRGNTASNAVNEYFKTNREFLVTKQITFIDTSEDNDLPWSPTDTLKIVLSDHSYFDVFYPEISAYVTYGGEKADIKIKSRDLLGY